MINDLLQFLNEALSELEILLYAYGHAIYTTRSNISLENKLNSVLELLQKGR